MRNLNRVKKRTLVVVLLIITVPAIFLASCSSGGGSGGSSQAVIVPPPPPPPPPGNKPNLDITNHSRRPTGDLTPDQSFTLSITVANNGDVSSPATTLRYYRSSDRTIDRNSDTQVGTDPVGAIAANDTSPESNPLTAPLTPGTYYYGACVDSVSGEADPSNDCTESDEEIQVVVAAVVSNPPNLDIRDHSVNGSTRDSTLTAGETFTLGVSVYNGGDRSPPTTLRYYLSNNRTIDRSDTQVGTDPVRALSNGGRSSESIPLTAPSSTGTYYYGACVDPVSGEADPGDDCTTRGESVQVVVVEPGMVTWMIADRCTDGGIPLEYRLFFRDRGRPPFAQTPPRTTTFGFTQTTTRSCIFEGRVPDQICYGGITGSTSFGLGLDGNSDCTNSNCCLPCVAGQTRSRRFDYRCP